jgi:hypothetical protein
MADEAFKHSPPASVVPAFPARSLGIEPADLKQCRRDILSVRMLSH